MTDAADPGFRDPDRSASFGELVQNLDHFNGDASVRAARRVLFRVLVPCHGCEFFDAGCGPGFDVAALAPKVLPGGQVVGLDLSERMIELARERHEKTQGVDFRVGDIQSTRLPAAFFDASYALRTVQYLDEPANAIRELARVTKPGGRVAVVEGGMSAADLPHGELTNFVFGPRTSLGVGLPNLFRTCGLKLRPSFTTTTSRVDPKVMEYARERTAAAVDQGITSSANAGIWLSEIEAINARGAWFSIECRFIVVGTVAG